MKKLTLISLTTISLLLNGCSSVNMMNNYQLDTRLPKLNNVKAVTGNTSVAFEWQPVSIKRLDAINIYRTAQNAYVNSAEKELTKVATVKNPFASHYVDTGLAQNSSYTYTFTTIKGGFESAHGQVINVKTKPAFEPIAFFQVYQKAATIIKLIWRPHTNKMVKMYKIEKSIDGSPWKWVDSIKNRMMSEYIDTSVTPGHSYSYRIIAVGFDNSISKSSQVITLKSR